VLAAGTAIGKYVVRRKLAEGGMAEIYLCAARGPEGFRKEVALKRIRPALAGDEGFVRMFIAEAQVAARLSHPNLVQIFDFDRDGETFYLAMELVRGVSLWELKRRAKEKGSPLPPALAASLCAEVARGLHHAHGLQSGGAPLGLVHRDVSPHNILLSFDGAVKLTDFGIAKAGQGLTAPGMLKGKFAYMSPEQARGESVDARTDVFALGIVLWELLTGGRLFEGESDLAVLKAVQSRHIPPPARLNPDVPAALDAATLRALERDPQARFQTALELERALSAALRSSPRAADELDLAGHLRRLFPDEARASDEEAGASQASVVAAAVPAPAAPATSLTPPAGALGDESTSPVGGLPAAPSGEPERGPTRSARRTRGLSLRAAAGVAAAGALLLGSVAVIRGAARPAPGPTPVAPEAPVAPVAPKPAVEPEAALAPVVAPATSSAPVPVPAAPPAVAPASRSRPASRRPGTLSIKVTPWGYLFIDGRAYGETSGVRRVTLPPGEHRVRVQYPTGEIERRVLVPSGGEVFEASSAPFGR
jgi:serine/threonine-protein kinase